ncbi:MAG: hypothetical protein HRT88_12055, partial [Lentisphaeraceae bacterium]|nr:hypothetical protein [Lentisphaeraceae bacterium]
MLIYRRNGQLRIEALTLVEDERPQKTKDVMLFAEANHQLKEPSTEERLLHSWDYISHLSKWDGEALYHIFIILFETELYLYPQDQQNPLIEFVQEIQKAKATAANPRAFKGTKYQPPKQRADKLFDLRQYLCDCKSITKILQRLWEFKDEAFVRLGELYSNEKLVLIKELTPDATSIYFHFHHGRECSNLTPGFCHYLLPHLKNSVAIRQFSEVYWLLALEQDDELFKLIRCLLVIDCSENTAAWLNFLATGEEKRRHLFIFYFIHQKAYTIALCEDVKLVVNTLFEEKDDKLFVSRIKVFLQALINGHDADYLQVGLELSRRFNPQYSFKKIEYSTPGINRARISFIFQRIFEGRDWESYRIMNFWEKVGHFPKIEEIFENRVFMKGSVQLRRGLFRFFIYCVGSKLKRGVQQVKIDFLLEVNQDVIDFVLTADYGDKALESINNYFWYWDDLKELEEYFPYAFALTKKLCKKPFLKHENATESISYFIDTLSNEARKKILNAGEGSYKTLEKFTRSENKAKLICAGVKEMSKYLPDIFVDGFCDAPAKLMNCLESLGCLPVNSQQQCFMKIKKHVLSQPLCADSPTEELMDFLQDEKELLKIPSRYFTEGQGKRLKQFLVEKLFEFRLLLFKRFIDEAFAQSFPQQADRRLDQHSLELFHFMEKNRRSCRRMLNNFLMGNEKYLMEHPFSQKWLEEQGSSFNSQLWFKGIEYSCEFKGKKMRI